MTSEDIEELIKSEVCDKFDTTNLHGINLTECLVKPVRLCLGSCLHEHFIVELVGS